MARSGTRASRPRSRRQAAQRPSKRGRRGNGSLSGRGREKRWRPSTRWGGIPRCSSTTRARSGGPSAGQWDVIDIHEEPFALATAEILLLRALRRNRAPVVLYTAQNLRKRYPIPFRWLERWALRRAAGVSACNADAAAIVAEKGFAVARESFRSASIRAQFAPAPERRAEGTRTRDEHPEIVVGFIGRLVPEKGVDCSCSRWHSSLALRLRIAGSGPAGRLSARARPALGVDDRVTLIGAVEPDEVATFYRSLDVLAVPSLTTPRWTEQFGRVAVEAMACGVPVVASDAGALPDVVGGAGLIVPQGDVPRPGHRARRRRAASAQPS